MVSAHRLARVKQRLEKYVDDVCTIKRRSATQGPRGETNPNYDIVAENVDCRVIKGESGMDDVGDQASLTETYRLIVPVGTELGVHYRVVLADGSKFEIIDVIDKRSDPVDAQALMVRERR